MPAIRERDVAKGRACYKRVANVLHALCGRAADPTAINLPTSPSSPLYVSRPVLAMAVRYSLSVLEKAVPGPSTEIRVPPFAAVKVLPGANSDPHNLTPPDVLEFAPIVWMRLACGVTSWAQEKRAGNVDAVDTLDERVSRLVPLPE